MFTTIHLPGIRQAFGVSNPLLDPLKKQNGPIATYLFLSASFAIILVNFLPAFFDMSVV